MNLDQIAEAMGVDVETLREMSIVDASRRASYVGKPERDRSKNKAAKKARRKNR